MRYGQVRKEVCGAGPWLHPADHPVLLVPLLSKYTRVDGSTMKRCGADLISGFSEAQHASRDGFVAEQGSRHMPKAMPIISYEIICSKLEHFKVIQVREAQKGR